MKFIIIIIIIIIILAGINPVGTKTLEKRDENNELQQASW